MKAPIGNVVSIYIDSLYPVTPGEALITTTGRLYLILESRQQTRGMHRHRKHLKCLVVREDQLAGKTIVHSIKWYPRKKKHA